MGYYTIDIFPKIHDLATMVTEFGKFRYNRISMGLCASDDIFQSKVEELIGDIEGFKTYIDDILGLG